MKLTRYVYKLARTTYNNTVEELVAVKEPIIIKGVEINSINKFGVRFKNNRTETVLFKAIITVSGNTAKEERDNLVKELQKIVKDTGLCCKYTYNYKKYLITVPASEQKGVCKSNGVIIHQLGIPNLIPYSEVVFLGQDPPQEEEQKEPPINSNEFTTYYNKWRKKLMEQLSYNVSYSYALLTSFILTFNNYINKGVKSSVAIKKPIYHIELITGNKLITKGRTFPTVEQFKFYIKPTYFGELNFLPPDNKFYSSLMGWQLLNAYYYFVGDFCNYLREE